MTENLSYCFHSHSFSPILSFSLSPSLCNFHPFIFSQPLFFSLTLSFSFTLSFSLTLFWSLSPFLFLSHHLCLTFTLSLCLPHSFVYSHPPSFLLLTVIHSPSRYHTIKISRLLSPTILNSFLFIIPLKKGIMFFTSPLGLSVCVSVCHQILPGCSLARGTAYILRILRSMDKSNFYGHFKRIRVSLKKSSISYFYSICLKLTELIEYYTKTIILYQISLNFKQQILIDNTLIIKTIFAYNLINNLLKIM